MDVTRYTGHPDVAARMARLDAACAGKTFSDLVDGEGRQYVDLVLEGGGVLGIALAGYAWVLERQNLRFLRVGGTSVGALAALLLAALAPPGERRTGKVLSLLASTDLWDFVDGGGDSRDMVEALASGAGRLKLFWKGIQVLDELDERLGLNPGNALLSWLSSVMTGAGADTTARLDDLMGRLPPGFGRRDGAPLSEAQRRPRLALVAADVTTETKVVFPRMAPLYFADPGAVNPALYVRASVSIPFFFSPVRVPVPRDEGSAARWADLASYDGPLPDVSLLVDGGVISNFPIDLFHLHGRIPSAPTFGAKLGRAHRALHDVRSPLDLGLAAFDAASHALDYDFIARHPDYRRLVTWIDTGPHSWLDFRMDDGAKVDLFVRGALAAADFLEAFDWEAYKDLRARLADGYL